VSDQTHPGPFTLHLRIYNNNAASYDNRQHCKIAAVIHFEYDAEHVAAFSLFKFIY
jgi:hypothetical protein